MDKPLYKHDKLLRGVLRLAVALMPSEAAPKSNAKPKPKPKKKAKPAPAPPPQPQPETAA